MASEDSSKEFDSSLFLKFLFSVIFLFMCCLCLMLYVDKALAFCVVALLRFFVLPRNIQLGVTGIHFAPLQARLLFRGFTLHTENLSVHIVDGYFTFAFWGSWFRHPRWSRVHDYMVSDTLVGTRCRVRRNLKYVKGTVVSVDAENRKVSVQFDEQSVNSSGDDEMEGVETATESQQNPSVDLHQSVTRDPHSQDAADMSSAREGGESVASVCGQPRRTTLKEFTTPVVVPVSSGKHGNKSPHVRSEGLGDEVVKVVDASDIFVRSRAGLFQVHLNGLRMCVYNATGKYMDLARAAAVAAQASSSPSEPTAATGASYTRDGGTAEKATKHVNAVKAEKREAGVAKKKRRLPRWLQLRNDNDTSRKWGDDADLDAFGRSVTPESKMLRAARELQEHNILSTSFAQKFFNFIGCVELEICAAQIDLGAVTGTHPYFLHLTFQQGEGRAFLTKDSCPALDLYRTVMELTLREVDIRMAQMDSKLSKTQVMRNATLYERARLLFSGVADTYEHVPFESTKSPTDLIGQYGVFMDGKDKGTVHLVCYKDAANVYAGEPIRRGALPTTGVEVLIDAPVVRYGPWLEYCRTQLWQYFLPPNYLPLQELQFEVGMPRPNAGFEMLVLFLRDTTVEIPFKRRSIVPSPPFGIKDSKRKGVMVATIGAMAQYIQPAFYLLPKEEKQVFQGLFIAKDVTVWANCVLERETILCHADSVQFFLDRQDDRLWNGRKLFNILTKLSGVELYWYMVYIDYFLDLLNDWQFAASMYHGLPLTTELFNTHNRSVRDFIPNVKRFEIFLESMASIYLNVNTKNVVYADDPNDMAHNIMAVLKVQSGRFSMVLPSDQYQLSFENEVARPLEASAHEVKAFLSVPVSHPLYEHVHSETPWAHCESFTLSGLFVMQVPNQSAPLQRDNLDVTTGRTKYHNYFNLDIELMNLRGTLMATHIKALIQSFQNIFLDNTFTIAPDELFWLLAKLQSHATAGKNKRKEFKQFLEQSQPAGNDMEICVTVRLVDVSATATTGQMVGAPQANLSCGLVTFTYVKQFAVTDTGVTLSPITLRLPDRRGHFTSSAESSIVVGAITVALTKHFGRMPLKPKVHEAMEVKVDGVSLEVTAEQLMYLAEVLQTLGRHFMLEDMMMEAEVADSLSTAELLAEKVVHAGPLRNTTDTPRNVLRRRRKAGRVHRKANDEGGEAFAAVPSGATFGHAASRVVNGSVQVDGADGGAGDVSEDSSGDETSSMTDAVEMQEWRSAQRAAAGLPRNSSDSLEDLLNGREESDAAVNVRSGTYRSNKGPPITSSGEPLREDLPTTGGENDSNHKAPNAVHNYGGGGASAVPELHSWEATSAQATPAKHLHSRKRRHLFFGDSSSSSARHSDDDQSAPRRRPFASTVPYDVALEFARFMEECNKADDASKDYGVFFLLVNVGSVRAVVRIGNDGYAFVELPAGASVAQSTVNDGNSNRRVSAAVKDIGMQLMLSRTSDLAKGYLPSLKSDTALGSYLEVLSLHTSVCVRQYVAYPFDKSLENHRAKQQKFVESNDYEGLIGFPFDKAATHYPPSPPPPSEAAVSASSPRGLGVSLASSRASNPRSTTKGNGMAEPATMPRPTSPPQPNVQRSTTPSAASPSTGGATREGTGSRGAASTAAAANLPRQDSKASTPGTHPATAPTTRTQNPPAALSLLELPPPPSSDQLGATPAFPKFPRAFTPDNSNPSSPNSSVSQNTTAHNQARHGGDSDNDGAQQSTLSGQSNLPGAMLPVAKEKLEASNRFETCVDLSSSNEYTSTTNTTTENFFADSSNSDSGRGGLDNRAFAADRGSSSDDIFEGLRSTTATGAGRRHHHNSSDSGSRGSPKPAGKGTKPLGASPPQTNASANTPAHLFYRTFDKAESDDNGRCAIDYWPAHRPSGPQKVRDRTGFHAQLPIVGFYPNTECETRAPLFFSYYKQALLRKEEDLFAWATCIADNRERSKNESTTRHLHVALLDPLTVLVAPEAAVLVAAAARLLLQVHVSLRGRRLDVHQGSASFTDQSGAGGRAGERRLLRSHTKKSKTRAQQKCWLWEANIMSVAVPTIELKVLTRLPVPAENLPDPSRASDGVYTTTVLVRNLRGLMSQNRPPSGEEVADVSQKMSASLRVDTLAMVSQIEWEPMQREGNLFAKIPNVWYDSEKATMAVMYLTEVAGKGKRDLRRGSNGGACNISTDQVAVHVSRDFAEYIHRLMHLTTDVLRDINARIKFRNGSVAPATGSSPLERPTSVAAARNPATGAGLVNVSGCSPAAPEAPRMRKSQTVQGKGFLNKLTVVLMDTYRTRQRIVVHENEVSQIEVTRPFCNFVVVTPTLLQDRHVHIQGVGEVELVKVHVLPSVLHVLYPQPVIYKSMSAAPSSTVNSPKAGGGGGGGRTASSTFMANSFPTVTIMDPVSSFSQTSRQESAYPATADGKDRGSFLFIYDGTFTVHQLDVKAKHSDTNYIHLVGKDLTGCAESRMEAVASRECVQTEALTESISEKLKARLRYKANRARERAKRSRYPAPPETTEQLHLRSTASFFAQQVQLYYVAECVVEAISHDPMSKKAASTCTAGSAAAPDQSIKANKVFSSDIGGVALVAQFANQFNLRGHQTNLHMIVRSVAFDSPYCVRAAEMLHPQVHALVSAWRQAVHNVTKTMRRASAASRAMESERPADDSASNTSHNNNNKSSASPPPLGTPGSSPNTRPSMARNRGITFQVQATSITGYFGLPQGIVQKFLLPQFSCFTKNSSHGRLDMKLHLHPFVITAHNAPQENYRVVLPHVYLLYGHDSIKMLCTVTMGTIALTITPLFINHTLLTYEKFIDDVLVVISSPGSTEDNTGSPTSQGEPYAPNRRDASSAAAAAALVSGRENRSQSSRGGEALSRRNNDDYNGSNSGRRDRMRDGRSGRSDGNPSASTKPGGNNNDNSESGQASDAPSYPAKKRRRQSFLFLLQGVRLSYLTSMTTLRFTVRNLNATADTTEGDRRHTLQWVVHVTDAQAALVDRDDHDQMVATYKNMSAPRGRLSSPKPEAAAAAAGESNQREMEPALRKPDKATETANVMEAVHPLGGLLWGSVGLSFTLSSGKVDENPAVRSVQKSATLNNYSEELQKALLESFINSNSKWELAVYEPLVILRIGLDSLIKQCIRETQEDVREMKRVNYEDNMTATVQLHRYKRFQRLQAEKKRIDGLIRRAQKERQRKLRSMTERVVHDMAHRRGGVNIEGSSNYIEDVPDLFSTTRAHKVVATVTKFMVVVPFGDAPFRSILEEMPDTFSCGKSDRHIHSAMCLNRRKFVPSYALKTMINSVNFICNLEVVKRLVPRLVVDPRAKQNLTDSVYATGGSADQGHSTAILFVGRLLAQDSHVYFSNGSPLNRQSALTGVLRNTCILGGQGVLTDYSMEEHKRALNSFSIASIEAPMRVERKMNDVTVGAVVDVSEPKGRISSLFVGILRELIVEQPTSKLEAHIKTRRRTVLCTTGTTTAIDGGHGGGANKNADNASQPILYSEEAEAPVVKEQIALHLDISGRLEASELSVFCYANPERFRADGPGNNNSGGPGGNGTNSNGSNANSAVRGLRAFGGPGDSRLRRPSNNSQTQRRVGFEARSATATHRSRWRSPKDPSLHSTPPAFAINADEHYLIMSVPLPGFVVRTIVRHGSREGVDDVAMVRAEVRAGTVELSPYITALAQEVEMCSNAYFQNRQEHRKDIFAFVQAMEKEVPQLAVPLHCALVEVLLPMPRAFANVLAKEELDSVVRLRSSSEAEHTALEGEPAATGKGDRRSRRGSVVASPQKRKKRGLISVHVTVSDFRLIFNTEPAASTYFTVYLDNGGTFDFVFKYFIRNDRVERFANKFPDMSLVATMRRLRAECQTKLEVKSFELYLPEAELTMSRRSGQIGTVDTIALFFPFNVEGTEPNLTVRLQHVAQLFLVIDIWTFSIAETLRSIRHLFARGAAGDDIAKRVARTQLAHQVAKGNAVLTDKTGSHGGDGEVRDSRTLVYIGMSRALCFCDIGAGSAHNFTLGEVRLLAEASHRASGCSVLLLMGRLSNMSIRSEGVLSGGMIVGDVVAQGFVIQNDEDAAVFVRSPEQRTFRETLLVRQVHVNFKERQLKDVFECKVGDFRGNSMDGIGEEDYTTTDLDAVLRRGTLGVTPSTVPAFISFMRAISTIVTDQRRIAAVKIKEKTLNLQQSESIMKRAGVVATEFKKTVWEKQQEAAGHETQSNASSSDNGSTKTQPARGCIPYMGSKLWRVPCGQLRVGLDDTTVLLGAISSGEAAAGCVVISFTKGRLSFAECPCDDYQAAKKVLMIETHNAELYRPGTPRVVVMGFQGVNHFEFYTRQALGSPEVGFALTLRQTNPWTGNPRFRDFEEMLQLIRSFTDKKTTDVIKQFGRLDTSMFETDMSNMQAQRELAAAELDSQTSPDQSVTEIPAQEGVAAVVHTDPRTLKALRSSKFSPQLRFGGDVSVNTEVILNWLGVTEKMLPHVVHMELCDRLESMLNALASLASERVQRRKDNAKPTVAPSSPPPAPPPKPVEARKLNY